MREKRQIILFIVIFLVLVGAIGTLTYLEFQDYQDLKKDIGRLEDERAAADRLIAEIPTLRMEAKKLSEQVEVYAEILPKEHEVRHDAFVETMDRFARETGLQILRADPFERKKSQARKKRRPGKKAEKESPPPFIEHRYLFELDGTFPSFLRFLNKIENWDRFLAVEEMEIIPTGVPNVTTGGNTKKVDEREIEAAQKPNKSIQLVVTTYTHRPKERTVDSEQEL